VIPYKFHPDADAELEEASLFYESRMAGLGRSFATEVERTISLVRQFPEAGSLVVQSAAEWSSRGSHTQSSIGKIPTPLSSSQLLISVGALVTGGGANSTANSALEATRMKPRAPEPRR
jgi:hypothetical protein